MAGISVARVVAVIAELDTGKTQVGSGYLIDAMRVLTAWHCTFDQFTARAALKLSVRLASDGSVATVTVADASPELDVAVLACEGQPPWSTDIPDGPARFGTLGARKRTGQLSNCEAVGYPLWQQTETGNHRDLAELHGLIRALDSLDSRKLILRDQALESVGQNRTVSGHEATNESAGAGWGGLSGAAVFHRDLLLGVIIEHHPRQGDASLQVRPIEAIATADDDATTRLAQALGLNKPGALHEVEARWYDYSDEPDPSIADLIEWFDRRLRPRPQDATYEQLAARARDFVPRRDEKPFTPQATEAAKHRLTQEPSQDTGASSEHCLTIILERDFSSDAPRYRMVIVLFRHGRDAVPQECDDDFVSLEAIREKVRSLLPVLCQGLGSLLMEFAVPDDLLGAEFDQWPLASYPGAPARNDVRLGERYAVVVRDVDHMKPHPELWRSRWQRLLDGHAHTREAVYWATPARFKPLWATLVDPSKAGQVVLALRPAQVPVRTINDMIRAGVVAGIPAAIWMRRKKAAKVSVEDDLGYLERAMVEGGLRRLPHRVQSLRLKAAQEEGAAAHPGRRVSLLWADPDRSWDPPFFEQPGLSVNGDDL